MSNSTTTRQSSYDYPVIEAQTITHFLEAAVTGTMPNSKKSGLALLSIKERTEYFDHDYSQWAQDSYHSLPGSPSSRVMDILALKPRPFHSASTTAIFHLVKSKVLEGISLVSYERWSSKRLDNQERINTAMAYIRLPISLFHYYHKPTVHGFMRDAYNRVYNELEIFQDAINIIRAERKEAPLHITALWSQYIRIYFGVMTQAARFWIFARLATLREVWKGRIYDVFLSGRQLNSTQRTVRVDHLALAIYRDLVDLGVEADKAVRFSIVGFKGLSVEGERDFSHDELIEMHMDRENHIRNQYNSRLNTARLSETENRRSRDGEPLAEFAEGIQVLFDRERAHVRLQPQVNVHAFVPLTDPWIAQMNIRSTGQFSFFAYRVSYKETDQEWEAFLTKMNAGIDIWSGFAGSDDIKKNARLQWIDGSLAGIAEGDLHGVRKHFNTFTRNNCLLPGMERRVCLAVDAACIKSFDFKPSVTALRSGQGADFGGYVIAVDSNYDGNALSRSYPPGYEGHVKVLQKLVMTDLYPMLYRECQTLDLVWEIAKDHPWHVYSGPAVEIEREEWRKMKQESADILGNLVVMFSQQNILKD